jgi:hypothetical protein
MFAIQFVPLGYQQITSLASAEKLTVPAGATLAIIKAEAQAVRWRDDGTAPTASVGMPMLATDSALEYSGTLIDLQFIAETDGAILNVSYYRVAG